MPNEQQNDQARTQGQAQPQSQDQGQTQPQRPTLDQLLQGQDTAIVGTAIKSHDPNQPQQEIGLKSE